MYLKNQRREKSLSTLRAADEENKNKMNIVRDRAGAVVEHHHLLKTYSRRFQQRKLLLPVYPGHMRDT